MLKLRLNLRHEAYLSWNGVWMCCQCITYDSDINMTLFSMKRNMLHFDFCFVLFTMSNKKCVLNQGI